MQKLMTQFDFSMVVVPDDGTFITLVESETKKEKRFYIKGNYNEVGLTSHMNSLTDSLCEQWFEESLTVEERKAKQKLRKEAAKKEREELDARDALLKAEAARIRAEQKAAEKARKAQKK